MAIRDRNVRAPKVVRDAIDISKIDLEADPNATLGVTANRHLQLPTLTAAQLVTAASGYNGALVYDTTNNALKACINGSFVELGAAGSGTVTVAYKTIDTEAGTDPVATAATDTLILTGNTGAITVTGDNATDTVTLGVRALGITSAMLETALNISGKTLTLPTSQTLTTPTVASFENATHDHSNDAGGGLISATTTSTGTTNSSFTVDTDSSLAKVAINVSGATGNFTATIAPANLSGDITLTLPAATGTFATLGGTETLTTKTLTAPVVNGCTSSGSTALNFGDNSGAFTTSTGTNTFSGNVAIATGKTFAQAGTGTFGTGTGAVSLNGDVTIAAAKSLAMSGAATITSGTGAIALNGSVAIATTKTLTMGSGTTSGGNLDIYRDASGNKSVALIPGTSLTIADNTAISGAYTFSTGTGTVTLAGDVTISEGKDLGMSGTATLTTGTGAVTLNGDVTVAEGMDIGMSGASTLTSGTGAVALNGDVTVATTKALTMGANDAIGGNITVYRDGAGAASVAIVPGTSITLKDNVLLDGAYTFGTGTSAVSLNGDTTVATTKKLIMGSVNTAGGNLDIYRDGAGAKGVAYVPGTLLTIADSIAQSGAYTFGTGTGNVSLNGDVSVTTGKDFAVVDGTVGLGSGAISTTYTTMVTNLNADKVDDKHVTDITAAAYINMGASGALGAATVFLQPGVEAADTTEDGYFIAPTAGTITKMYTKLGTAPGGADTVAFTLRIDGADKTVTCTTTADETASNDTAHTEAVTAGQLVSVKAVSSNVTAADASVTLEFRGACA